MSDLVPLSQRHRAQIQAQAAEINLVPWSAGLDTVRAEIHTGLGQVGRPILCHRATVPAPSGMPLCQRHRAQIHAQAAEIDLVLSFATTAVLDAVKAERQGWANVRSCATVPLCQRHRAQIHARATEIDLVPWSAGLDAVRAERHTGLGQCPILCHRATVPPSAVPPV